ncbi:MAG: prolyl oligopeptidase family serine peptidase [Pirellulales bacterium]|nr:prolyl oligopeptidase family serine peptidase [Pirellulales bacterium]
MPTTAAERPRFDYPATKTVDQADEYHGTRVADPYRWLEEDVRESPAVAEWVEAQNRVTFGYLEKLPQRQKLRDRLTEIWNYERFSAPMLHGGKYYFYKNDGLQNQAVLYVQDTLTAEPRVVLDPNTWSKDGTIALAGMSFSDDGRYLAYGRAKSGSDWNTWHVLDLTTGKLLPDELDWIKFSGASWTPDNRGFYYSRYPQPASGESFKQLNLDQKVYYHALGTAQDTDRLVYERPDEPTWTFSADVTEDGNYLIITVSKGTDDKYRIFYQDLQKPDGKIVPLIDNFDQEYSFIGNDGRVMYFRTDRDAPRRRVISIDLDQPEQEHWRELIPQSADTLESISLVGDQFFAEYLHDAQSQIKVFDLAGKFIHEVPLPGIGSASGFGGKRKDTETFYTFSSFTTPANIFRYDLASGKSELLRQAKVKFDPDKYVVKQEFATSRDGTRVPLFIIHRRDIKLDGSNPTLLYGYGGFSISLTPGFSVSRIVWLEQGGVLAVANLRGGGEYGEEWHKAGTKLNKQNVFDDFIAAAEWLIEHKYTRPDKLAIQGGSNGGLLVGAAMTQRPELFGAAIPAVGVMDMLRFHKFTAGRFWVDDYGSADDPTEFAALYKYSPYHNLKPGTKYPATLIITADTDDRVVPGHSFKYAAALQAAHTGDAPVLIRIETKAGHGAGKPTSKLIEEAADQWAFLLDVLGN